MSYISELQGDVLTSDATLVTKGASFPVHRIVLAAASPFFKEILKVSFYITFLFFYVLIFA